MAGGGGGGGAGRSLEETPTWAVAVVCFVLVLISIFIEHIIHLIGKWLTRKNKKALYEALEKIKSELMLLGFISLLLTVGADPISRICIPQKVADSWHPCNKGETAKLGDGKEKSTKTSDEGGGGGDKSEDLTVTIGRRLLHIFNNMEYASANDDHISSHRRVLAGGGGGGGDKCSAKGKVPLISGVGINQLHIFIFVLAISHVLYCIITLVLGRLKMRSWKSWENETKTVEYEFTNDPERFRFARDTSFGRRHLHFWSKSPILIWIVCFFRQFVRSVPKVDYLTLRHGFIMAHLAPQGATKFDFQKYIQRSLEDDFKVVVGISPPIWFFAVLFLLFNTHGWYSYLWLPFIPLILILLVGTKLQVIITRMGLRIHDRGDVVKGVLTVKPADDLFWFSRPRLMLYIINFVLFQNAFQLAFFVWTWYEFGFRSCFHKRLEDIIIRITMGVLIQILCSYVILPLYALVTQMGSTMKPTIFHDRVATALRKWHHTARKHIKQQNSRAVTPLSSRPGTPRSSMPGTPLHGFSPVHLLKNNHRSEMDSFQNSPTARFSNTDYNNDQWDSDQGSPIHHRQGEGSSSHHHNQFSRASDQEQPQQHEMKDISDMSLSDIPTSISHPVLPRIVTNTTGIQHEIDIRTDSTDPRREIKNASVGFSFAKR